MVCTMGLGDYRIQVPVIPLASPAYRQRATSCLRPIKSWIQRAAVIVRASHRYMFRASRHRAKNHLVKPEPCALPRRLPCLVHLWDADCTHGPVPPSGRLMEAMAKKLSRGLLFPYGSKTIKAQIMHGI